MLICTPFKGEKHRSKIQVEYQLYTLDLLVR